MKWRLTAPEERKAGKITTLVETITVLITFKIRGNLRFLSHSETVSVFERACVRAEVALRYSEGFNPRPRLSLPLPKSVGMEVDGDLACIGILGSDEGVDAERLAAAIGGELPAGMEVVSVELHKGKAIARAETETVSGRA